VNLKEALYKAESIIASQDIADARNEAELLLMHSLGIGRAELYTRLQKLIYPSEVEGFWYLVQHRCHHEPTAYILKQCQFYGVDFYIDSRALIPRPESELLVDNALEFIRQRFPSGIPFSIADVGTGSGALAIVVALHLPQAEIYAIDVSAAALEVARMNCSKHGVEKQVRFLLGDMLQPLPEPVDIILANLPYVKDSELPQLVPEIKNFEPIVALAGGQDGLEKVRQLLPQAKQKLLPGGLILLEIGQGQGPVATALVKEYFPTAKIDLIPDLAGIDRVVRVVT
jgi:release factor glutamine methyltransferase